MKTPLVVTTSAWVHPLESPAAAPCPAAPRRGLDVPSPAAWSIERPLLEEALLEQVRQFGIKEGRRYFTQVEVRTCQDLDPKAVSQVHPPERCWFLRLAVSQPEGAGVGDEVQVIVFLSAGALHLFFR